MAHLKTPLPTKIVIVADDLTGALDSSVAFAERGLSVAVARTPDKLGDALASGVDVVAVSTGTREYDPETADAVLNGVKETLRAFQGILFKKIDSRLKGNILVETNVLAALRPGDILVCPAIPRLGRQVKNGAVIGEGVDQPIPVAPCFGSLRAEIPDALEEADIDRAIHEPFGQKLFVGAAGLSAALARKLVPGFPSKPHSVPTFHALLAIGSRDPVTVEQAEILIGSNLPVGVILAPNGVPEIAATDDDAHAISIVQMVPGAEQISADNARQIFAQNIVARVKASGPKTLFTCGGESANAILEGLGINLLQVRGEILPGVPWSVAEDGMPGLNIVTKSGGFGDSQTLIELCNALLVT